MQVIKKKTKNMTSKEKDISGMQVGNVNIFATETNKKVLKRS